MSQPGRRPRRLWRYRYLLLLLAVGFALWPTGLLVPGAPARIPGLRPTGVAAAADGSVYVSDGGNDAVWRLRPRTRPQRVAGSGRRRRQIGSGDGGPALHAKLDAPLGVAVGIRGDLYIADQGNHRVRKVDMRGTITTVAGTGQEGYGGDGGPAVRAKLSRPQGVAVDARGNLYVADNGNSRVRKVDAQGIITTVAGTGGEGCSGDGGPAVKAELAGPVGVVLGAQGDVYLADLGNQRVRKVDARGIITTVAGTGKRGDSGDGGPAARARLCSPMGVALDARGDLYIADTENNRVRKVNPQGLITTIAGTGQWGASGDGDPAVQAKLAVPSGVAVDARGSLYVADWDNWRVRKVDTLGVITTVAAGTRFPW